MLYALWEGGIVRKKSIVSVQFPYQLPTRVRVKDRNKNGAYQFVCVLGQMNPEYGIVLDR